MTRKILNLKTLVAAYLVTRLPLLLTFPIFNDEAIYLKWSIIMTTVPGRSWLSFTHDGKPPLLMWIWGLLIKTTDNPLLFARLTSVILGLITLIGIYKIGQLLGGKRTSIISSLLYIFWPMSLWYDRLALMEASQAALVIWSYYILIKSLEGKSYKSSITLGFLLGIGIWIKQSFLLWAVALLIACIGLMIKKYKSKKTLFKKISIAFFISFVLTIPLLIKSQTTTFSSRITDSIITPSTLSSSIFTIWLRNLKTFSGLFIGYGSVLIGLGLWLSTKIKNSRNLLIATTLALSPSLLLLLFATVLNSRYTYPFLVACIPLAGWGIARSLAPKKHIPPPTIILTLIFLAVTITQFTLLLTRPTYYFHTLSFLKGMAHETVQTEGWPSGYGVSEAVAVIEEFTRAQPALVLLRRDSGNPEDAILLSLRNNQNTKIMYVDEFFSREIYLRANFPVIFVSRGTQMAGFRPKHLTLISKHEKPYNHQEFVGVWQLNLNSFKD